MDIRIPDSFARVERGSDADSGEARIVEVTPLIDGDHAGQQPVRVKIDDVPEDSISISPDAAAGAAAAMLRLSHGPWGQLGFRVEYVAD